MKHMTAGAGSTVSAPPDPGREVGGRSAASGRRSVAFGVGLMLIIGGGVLTVYGLTGGVVAFVSTQMVRDAGGVDGAVVEALRAVNVFQGTSKFIEGALSLFAFVSGVGLMRQRPWGRVGARAWSVAAVGFLAADAVIYVLAVAPRLAQLEALLSRELLELPGGGDELYVRIAGSLGTISGAWYVVSSAVLLVPPVLIFGLLGRRT